MKSKTTLLFIIIFIYIFIYTLGIIPDPNGQYTEFTNEQELP